jgi:hypothetical protein
MFLVLCRRSAVSRGSTLPDISPEHAGCFALDQYLRPWLLCSLTRGWVWGGQRKAFIAEQTFLTACSLYLSLHFCFSFLCHFSFCSDFFLGSKTRKKQQCTPLGTVRDSLLDSPIVFLSFLLSTLFYSAKSFLNTAKLRLSRGLFDRSVGCVSLIGITIHDLALSIFPQHSLQSFYTYDYS